MMKRAARECKRERGERAEKIEIHRSPSLNDRETALRVEQRGEHNAVSSMEGRRSGLGTRNRLRNTILYKVEQTKNLVRRKYVLKLKRMSD